MMEGVLNLMALHWRWRDGGVLVDSEGRIFGPGGRGGGCGFGCDDDVYIWGWLGTLEGGSPFGSHLYKGFGSFCYVWIVVSDSPFAMVPGVAAAFFCRDLFVTGGVKRSMKVVFRGRDLLSHYRLSFVGILSSGESRDDLSGRKDDDMQQATEMPLFSDGLNTCDRTPDIIAELAEVSPDQFHSA